MGDSSHEAVAARTDAPRATAPAVEQSRLASDAVASPRQHSSVLVAAGTRLGGGAATVAARGDRQTKISLLLSLQRQAGNLAVQSLVDGSGPSPPVVQRGCGCGTCARCPGDTGREGEEVPGEEPVTVSRQGSGAPPAPAACVVKGGSPLEQANDAFAQGTPECLDKAWGILVSRAMSDLLPLLEGLKKRGKWPQITAGASGRGGPRMVVATEIMDLKGKGTPIGKADLRAVIDKVQTLPPDQRADIFRYLGKHVSLTVEGIDIDLSYCQGAASANCEAELKDSIKWAKKMIGEYSACLKPGNKNSNDVENCVHASLAKQGIGTVQAGGTSATGAVTVAASPMTKCQPILTRGTEIHEGVHQATTFAMQKKYGAGTPAFTTAWHDGTNWIADEVKAYGAEVTFYSRVLGALKTVCKALA